MSQVIIAIVICIVIIGTFVDLDPRNSTKVWIGIDTQGMVRALNRGPEPNKFDLGGNPLPSDWKWEQTTLKDGLERMK